MSEGPLRREPPPPLPESTCRSSPKTRAWNPCAQIRMTGRAYPLFDIAQERLQKPDRVNAVFSVKKSRRATGSGALRRALDDSLWLSESRRLPTCWRMLTAYRRRENRYRRTAEGRISTFVAQCGMSGQISAHHHHDYQNQLRKLHAERFSRMPFEAYKSRVRIVRDERSGEESGRQYRSSRRNTSA